MLKHISCQELKDRLDDPSIIVVDIRDHDSFQRSHIPGAVHLSNDNAFEFLSKTSREQTVVVCCYHGISSISAGNFLLEQDFEDVFSLDGGFEQWELQSD